VESLMESNDERRCLIIDAQPAIRLGVRGALGDRYDVEEAADGHDALELIGFGGFDVAIVELAAANGRDTMCGLTGIRALRKASPGLGIVAYGARAERHSASEAIAAGATAFVAKSSSTTELVRAVDAAAAAETFVDPAARKRNGETHLTRRQREILQLYANGLSTQTAAQELGLSTETVRTHTKAVLSRLEARDRTHAVAIGLRSSLID
jgi:DNA-binding NarL/FixJ family response regulator